MAIIGFHYTKMSAEKNKRSAGKVNVKTNVKFDNVKEAKVNMGTAKQKGAEFSFSFDIQYTPDVGEVEMKGALVYMGEEDKIQSILDGWEKDEKVPADIMQEVYNYILGKCNVQALVLEKDMGLPPHIQMPKLQKK